VQILARIIRTVCVVGGYADVPTEEMVHLDLTARGCASHGSITQVAVFGIGVSPVAGVNPANAFAVKVIGVNHGDAKPRIRYHSLA